MSATVTTRFRRGRLAAAVALLVVVLPVVAGERRAVAAPPTVTCATDANIFNTGYDAATGTVLKDGKEDANWEVAGRYDMTDPVEKTSLPPADAVWEKPKLGNAAPGYWSDSPYGNAQWIAKESTSADGDWYYRYRFTLDPAVRPADFALSMNFLADNTVAEVYVNDVPQSTKTNGLPQNADDPYHYVGYNIDQASKTFLNHDWRTGENTIIVHIKSGNPAEGFLAQVRPSLLCPRPAIKLQKSASPTTPRSAGVNVKYSFIVTNIGNEPLTGVTVTESAFSGKGAAPAVSCPGSALAVEEVMTCTAEYTVTQADYDAAKTNGVFRITNTATASGTPPSDPPVTSQPASATVTIYRPYMVIVKATTKAFVTEVGEQVPYTFSVTNPSIGLTATNVAVTDPKIGAVTCPATSLGAGKTMECTGTYMVTQADLDAGRIVNSAILTAKLSGANVLNDSNEVVVPALYRPALTIVKASTTTTFESVGAQIPYTFTVTNTGNVTVHDVAVNDPKVGAVNCPLTEIKPGEGTVCTGTYTTTQDDVDAAYVVNQAAVAGKTPANAEVTAVSNRHVVTANPLPQLAIVKSTTSTFYDKVGQTIPYAFTVINTGNQSLRDVKVTDPLLGGAVCSIGTLAPGAQSPCTASFTTTAASLDAGRVSNQAKVAGTSPSNDPVEATSNLVMVPAVHAPQLTMVKSSTSTTLEGVGAKIPYEFTVINTGNVTVENVKITDEGVTDLTCPATTLALGERMTCTAGYTITQADIAAGQVVNKASADGDVPASGRKLGPTPSNEVVVRAAAEAPANVEGANVQPGVTGLPAPGETPAPAPAGQLPRTGRDMTTEPRMALLLMVVGTGLLAAGRRLGRRVWPAGPGR